MKPIYLMIFGLVVMFAGVGCITFSLDGGWSTLTTVGAVLSAVGFIVTAVGFFWKKEIETFPALREKNIRSYDYEVCLHGLRLCLRRGNGRSR